MRGNTRADGYFILPATIGDYLATEGFAKVDARHPAFTHVEQQVKDRVARLLAINGRCTVDEMHRALGKILWDDVGMVRSAAGLQRALSEICALREEFWRTVKVAGGEDSLNASLEKAGRVADFLELGELMVIDALQRDESCGSHSEKTILDSSSGNAGIAYAMIGAVLGRRVELVVPANASEERKKRIHAHGATLILTDPVAGYDEALREVRRRATAHPERYFFCDQYSNPANWYAHYDTTAAEILTQTQGQIDWFVAGVGTGALVTT